MVCCLKKKPKPEEERTLEQDQCPSVFIAPLFDEGGVEAGLGGRVSELHGLPAYTLQDHNPPPSYWVQRDVHDTHHTTHYTYITYILSLMNIYMCICCLSHTQLNTLDLYILSLVNTVYSIFNYYSPKAKWIIVLVSTRWDLFVFIRVNLNLYVKILVYSSSHEYTSVVCCLSHTQHTTFIFSWGEDSTIFSISENVHFWWNMINGYLKIDATCTLLLLLSFRKTPSSTQKHHFHTLHSHRKHRLDRTTMTSSTRATHPMPQMHRLDFKVKLCLFNIM